MTMPKGRPTSAPVDRSVADYLLASKRCDIRTLEQLRDMGRLVASVSELVHAMQRERGISNLYVASKGGRCGSRLPELVQASLLAEREFRERLAELDIDAAAMPGGSRLFSRIAHTLHGLDELHRVRGEIRELKLSPDAIIEGYTGLLQSLLAVVFEAADAAADPAISRALVAMFHLMQGKELAGQERAVGVIGFARGAFSPALVGRMRHLIDQQERCFQVFNHFADQPSRELWAEGRCSEGPSALERLRRIAFSTAIDGNVDESLSDTWFSVATQRIDGIKRVEDQLERSLVALCGRKIAEAREDLDCHRVQLDALADRAPEAGTLAVFFDRDTGGSAGGEALDTGYASPQLAGSLIDLVRSQSARLQAMNEELQQARSALADRKAIEKAKGKIMQHRGINEDEAYRFLREVAMAQSRKLAEVARDIIAMSDIFGAPPSR